MQDPFSPQSSPGSSFGTGPPPEAMGLDESVRRISAVEAGWRLPGLPDEVKLDLASHPDLNPQQAADFLSGLDLDFADEDEENRFSEVAEADIEPILRAAQEQQPVEPRSRLDDLRVLGADIFNQPAPTDPDVDAVTKFKMRAIEAGLLERPADGMVDNTWDRTLNGVFFDMANKDYQDRISGIDSIDSIDSGGALELIAEWTQPGHLIAAAMDLDLLPDVGAIWRESTNWADKWRDVGESDGAWDLGKNLLDAVLGPIDDIAMPILTWTFILGTGGAGALALAPKAAIAVKLATSSKATAVATKLGKTSDLGLASMTANRLLKADNAIAKGAGGAMKAWRAATPVVAVKSVLQPAMRAGVLSQAQQALPSYASDGFSLFDVPDVARVGPGVAHPHPNSPLRHIRSATSCWSSPTRRRTSAATDAFATEIR